jgi:hypothetical protein
MPAASPANVFFRRDDLQLAPGQNSRPVGALNAIGGFSFSWESDRRLDDGENSRLERGGKFFPCGDYLGQIRT